jgi:hypothetical protein
MVSKYITDNSIMAVLTRQYEESPLVPLQDPSIQDTSNSNKSGVSKKYLYAGIVLLVIAIVLYFLVFSGSSGKNGNSENISEVSPLTPDNASAINPEDKSHGNKICDTGENCFDDPADCKCAEEEYCSDQKICLGPVCGNGKCELYEGPDNCCIDCDCIMPNEMCNLQTKSCGPLEMNLSEERALEIASKYFEALNISSELIMSEGVYKFGDKLVRQFSAQAVSEGYTRRIGISDTEEVIEIPTMQ